MAKVSADAAAKTPPLSFPATASLQRERVERAEPRCWQQAGTLTSQLATQEGVCVARRRPRSSRVTSGRRRVAMETSREVEFIADITGPPTGNQVSKDQSEQHSLKRGTI